MKTKNYSFKILKYSLWFKYQGIINPPSYIPDGIFHYIKARNKTLKSSFLGNRPVVIGVLAGTYKF